MSGYLDDTFNERPDPLASIPNIDARKSFLLDSIANCFVMAGIFWFSSPLAAQALDQIPEEINPDILTKQF